MKREISSIVGLREIKKQLESILQKIIDAEKNAADGFRVVPPKPFHMVFVGRNGTGTPPQLQSIVIYAHFRSNGGKIACDSVVIGVISG